MLKVLKPNRNKQTGGYTPDHHGYDHSGSGDQNCYSSFYGVVVQSKNSEERTWQVNTPSDPYKVQGKTRKLLTEDYGNYIKIKGEVDGQVVYQLTAHLKKGTVLSTGTEVKKGQIVAQIGSTGNSTGPHSHTEYRDVNNVNFAVEFVDEEPSPTPIMEDKKQTIIDLYKGITGEYPNDDEISNRLQQNKNKVELIVDLLTGDGRSKIRWAKLWGVGQLSTDWEQVANQYKQTYEDLKGVLKLSMSADTEEVAGRVQGLLNRIVELEKATTPEIIYKLDGKDFNRILKIGNITIIMEKGAE